MVYLWLLPTAGAIRGRLSSFERSNKAGRTHSTPSQFGRFWRSAPALWAFVRKARRIIVREHRRCLFSRLACELTRFFRPARGFGRTRALARHRIRLTTFRSFHGP